MHTERATTILLKHKKHKLKELFEQSYVDEAEYAALRYEIDSSLLKYKNNNYLLEEIKFSEVVTQCPLFSSLSANEMTELRRKTKENTYEKDAVLISEGKELTQATIIISGSVRDDFGDFYVTRSIGNVLNPYDFTYGLASKSTSKARNTVKVHELDRAFITQLLKTNNFFRRDWYKSLFVYCMHISPGFESFSSRLNDREMRRFIDAAEILLLKGKEVASINVIGYVFEGEAEGGQQTYARGSYIPKGAQVRANTECVLINFKEVPGIEFGRENSRAFLQEKFDDKN